MEGAVIGYVPYVQPAKSSSIPDCYKENSFIHLPRSTNVPDCVEEGKMFNTTSLDVDNEQDSVAELTSNLNEDRKRLSLKSRNNNIAGKSEVSERKGAPAETSPAKREVVGEIPSKVDQPGETNSGYNEAKSQRVSLKRSSSMMLEPKSEQTSQTKKLYVDIEDGSNTSLFIEPGSSDSGSDSMDKMSSKTELSVLSLSAANASTSSVNLNSSNMSPRLSPVDPEPSESAGKKRYLFDFRPNTHQIIVKNKSGEKSFKCFVCGGIYQQKFSLKRHYLRNHIDFRYISENDISNCNIPIPYYIKKLHSSLDYKKSSNGRKKFKKSNSDIFLDNNEEHLMPGLYRCHDCPNITCDTETELKDHYNKHPEAIKKKFHCEVCDASFFKKQILSRHLASHGKKKSRFECKKCNTDFPSQGELMLHSDSHVTGKTCKYCGKNLSTSANRKRHEALHLGLKPYNCTICGSCFAQSKDLDRHLRKQHSEFCRECPQCNKLFSTEVNLENHIREKHSESPVKKQDPGASLNNAERENNVKLSVAPSIPAAKPKSCTVCKRSFHTVYAMLKHKRQAHPYYSRKKKRVKQKVAQNKQISNSLEFRKTYAQPQKVFGGHSESPAKRGRPIQKPSTSRDSEKYVRRNGRPGPRSVSKREEESFKEFYGNVAYQINKNILHHIDGRATQLSLKQYNFNDCPYSAEFFEEQGRLPWSHYNFPQWYDVDNALKTKGQEIKRPENLSSQDEFLYDATGLAPCNRPDNPAGQANNREEVQVDTNEQNRQLTLEERKKLIGKEVVITILCCVCRETFNSHEDYEQHIVNNHPNVDCNFTVFEGDKKTPPEIPPEFMRTHLSPVGYRFSCDVPPSVVEGCMKCTKCKSEFPTRAELYCHLTTCGNLRSYSSGRVWKHNAHKRIKNTMKNRMSAAEQLATLNATDDYLTPEKQETKSNSSHSTGKASKSTEKLQFYKSGRLQTTSLTVDMNYFNTKPTKPAKNLSKRGRKSYALVSSMYRNATAQASSSRECSDCRTAFPSVSALNQHLKSHHPESSIERTYVSGKVPADYTPDRVQNTSEHPKTNVEFPTNSSPEISRSRVNLFPSAPAISGPADDVSKMSSPSKADNQINLPELQPADAPIDLSTSSCDRNEADSNDNNAQKRSALQIAMDAVLKFSVNDDSDAKARNEHISKLQETVEKLTVPALSPVSKHNVVRKVGRPKKLKKDDSSPSPPLNFNSGLLGIGSPSKSKPISRLEEAVERLKSKVSSQDKNRENSATGVSVTDKDSAVLQNEKRAEISNLKEPSKPLLLDDKEKSGTTTINKSSAHDTSNLKGNGNANNSSSITADKVISELNDCTVDKLSSKCKTGHKESSTISEKTPLAENATPVENRQLPKVDFEKDEGSQKMSALPSSEFPTPERSPEKVNQSSHGRSSPTFDSILKVINQKLHSEEEESSQHDDTAITWLEDEQFEIPPSRGNLNILVNANPSVELMSTESSGSKDVGVSSGNPNLSPNVWPEKLEATKMPSESLNNKTVEKPGHPDDPPKEVASDSNEVQTLPKDQSGMQKEMPKIPEISVTGSNNISQESVSANDVEKTLKTSKEIKIPSESRPPARRGPGRPRKKVLENVDVVIQGNVGKESMPASKPSNTDLVGPVDKNTVPDNTPSRVKGVTNDATSNTQGSQKKFDLPQDITKHSNEAHSAKCSENEEPSSVLSNSDEPVNANQSEQPAVSLRAFRTKAKQAQGDSNTKPSFPLKNNITTEFGKSLASKMKEKMRLSFEQDSSKNTAKFEEPTASVPRSTCDANSQPRDKLKTVKKECDTAEPTKIHSCPYCMLEFAYLTNFRRHLKACLARTESKEADSTPGNSATNLQHLPKKDEVDYSMLNLYRHQSRQTQMLKEVEKNLGSDTPIKKYECTVCHRIYLNLFTFLQHKITQHNLAPQASSEASASTDSSSCPSEMNDIGNTFATEPASDPTQQENDLKLEERVNYESLIDSFISEQSNESAVDDPPVCDFKEVDGTANEPQCPILEDQTTEIQHEDTDERQLPDLPCDSNDSESVKDETTPVKRKRGRPFGWRKHASVSEEEKSVVERKKETQNSNKNSALTYKRVGRPPSSATEAGPSSKLKSKTKKVLLNKVEKVETRLKPVDENVDLNDSLVAAEVTKPDKVDSQSSQNTVKEELKDSPKPPVSNASLSEDDFVSTKPEKISKSTIKTKTTSPAEVETKNKAVKRGRGRPTLSVADVPKTSNPTPEVPPAKRRPGRPPKNLQAAAGPSQPVKHIANALPIRSGRKLIPVTVESSDSECEMVEPEIPVKKKISKVCSICKKKFLSSLALHRHIQIVHSRRTQAVVPTAAKATDLPAKVAKKSTPRSPVADSSDGDFEIVAKRVDEVVVKKTPNSKICPICKGRFDAVVQLRNHLQTFHSRKSEPSAGKLKIPPPETPESDGNQRLVANKSKKSENLNRSSLTRQCRKSLPMLQKRVKNKSPEQMKKQKL